MHQFNISKIFRALEKYKYRENIKKCFPPYDGNKFNEEIIKQMIPKIDEKTIRGGLSKTWLFNEFESVPKPVSQDDIKEKDDFMKESKKTKGKGLNLNLDILKIKDLSMANSLDKIISVLNNGFSISQAFMFCIGKLKEDKIKNL